MLEKPNLEDERLIARLREAYGLLIRQLTFLPLGADVGSAVYRAAAADGTPYFVKLRRGPLDEVSVALPRHLADLGIQAVIPPLSAAGGRLWTRLADFTITVYPFVAGRDGYEVALSADQWAALGATLKALHAAELPASLGGRLPRETYSPHWREQVRRFQGRAAGEAFADPIAQELGAFLRRRAAVMDELVAHADRLGRTLARRRLDYVPCHGDIHAGNVLIAADGALYIVDWDTAVLAPKECDLMSVGAGIAGRWSEAEQAQWFYRGYGPADVDAAALAYYRSERIVQDIAAFGEQILATDDDTADRRQALAWLTGQFEPGHELDIALDSARAVAAAAGRPG